MSNSSCDMKGLLSLDSALNLLEQSIVANNSEDLIPLSQGLNRILSRELVSTINVPPQDNSAMDGYALRANDVNTAHNPFLHIVGKSFAGTPFNGRIEPGECVRIMTGAVVPEGADCIVMQEKTQTLDNKVKINVDKLLVGDNIRLAGNDIAVGDTIAQKGKRLSPIDLGLIASVGIGEIPVYSKLKIGIFSTGDELLNPTQAPTPSAIFESNRVVIAAMLQNLNVEILDLGIIPDNKQAISAAFNTAAQQCDAIISSGGVSVGEADYTRDVLLEQGEVTFYKLAVKPGKPFAFGRIYPQTNDSKKHEGTLFFGLPGNPISAIITFHQLVIPSLRKMYGEGFLQSPQIRATTENTIKKRPGRTELQRGFYYYTNDSKHPMMVKTLANQSSGALSEMSKANCLIYLEQETSIVDKHSKISIIPFDRWLL